MYLVNALNFEAKWADQYADYQVSKSMFTEENGNQTEMDMLFSTENEYLCNDFCYGVKKRYESGYSFVALLPNEGETVSDLLEKMDGNAWMNMVNYPITAYDVDTKIPKFEKDSSYSKNPSNPLNP
jgi:serpin B